MKNDHIFISIASYRDPYLPHTIETALENARHPDNLHFGICWQRDETESLDPYTSDTRFTIHQCHYSESGGLGWARSLIQEMYADEEFHLLIDSHMHFGEDWDVDLIAQLRSKPSEKPLLTTFSPDFSFDESGKVIFPWEGTDMGGVPLLKCVGISEAGEVDLQMSTRRASEPNTRTYFLCANFVFTHGSWITEVPCDPHIHQYGEEANLAIRSYTHGYDLFVPDRIKVWHLDYLNYDPERKVHSKRAKIYRDLQPGEIDVVTRRSHAWQRILLFDEGDHQVLGRYGLGSVRSREEWEAKANVSLKDRRPCTKRLGEHNECWEE